MFGMVLDMVFSPQALMEMKRFSDKYKSHLTEEGGLNLAYDNMCQKAQDLLQVSYRITVEALLIQGATSKVKANGATLIRAQLAEMAARSIPEREIQAAVLAKAKTFLG